MKASEMSTNVTSVEAARRINPEQLGVLDRIESDFAGQDGFPIRTLTRLDADYYAAAAATVGRTRTGDASGPDSARPRDHAGPGPDGKDSAWLRLLERAVGGWAPTLRGSLVSVTIFLAAAVLMVVALGFGGLALAGGLTGMAFWINAAGRLPRS